MQTFTITPLADIEEALKTALPWLEQAYCLMNSNRLDGHYTALYTAVCDAMTATQEAIDCLDDAPDQVTCSALAIHPKETLVIEVVEGELMPDYIESLFALVRDIDE